MILWQILIIDSWLFDNFNLSDQITKKNYYKIVVLGNGHSGNLLSFLLRCGTRPYERGTQWDLNSLV